jgi:hypothetical protein
MPALTRRRGLWQEPTGAQCVPQRVGRDAVDQIIHNAVTRIMEQCDRVQEVINYHWLEHVQLKVSLRASEGRCSHTARSVAPRPVAGGSNQRSIDLPAQGYRSWTTNGLLKEAGYCIEAGGESQEPGEVPGTRLALWSLWYGLVTRSLTMSIVTLKLRATTIPF